MIKLTLNYFRILFLMSALPNLIGFIPFIPYELFGFNMTGWAWLTVLVVSVIYFFLLQKVTFPVWIWIPWILYLVVYIAVDFSFFGFQLTLQYIVSIFVGIVISGLKYNQYILKKIIRWFTYLIIVSCGSLLLIFIKSYGIEDLSFGAAQVMTLNVAAVIILAVFYVTQNQKMILYFWILAMFPIIQVTRMGMVMMFAIAPLHFANKKIRNKIVMSALVVAGGVVVFYSDAFQKKSFYSGKGDLTDLLDYQNNENFDTSGRKRIYELVNAGIALNPIWGNGPRADLKLLEENGFLIKEVHNDYLSIQYNYGAVGLTILLLSLLGQFLHLWLISNSSKNFLFKVAIYSSLTLFIPMLGFMYSDNLLKYSIFFGNFHFALMGISYAMLDLIKKRDANIRRYTALQQKRAGL